MISSRFWMIFILPFVLAPSKSVASDLVPESFLRESEEKKTEAPTKAKMVHYSGKVQGVGFRATAVDIAADHPVTGSVKNLADGRVELVVEGSDEAIEKFLKAIRDRWKNNIEKEQIEEQKATGKYKGFTVAR